MSPKIRQNRPIERAGINATRSLFEASKHIFQEVDLGNDFGKDAYVDLVEGNQVTGVCVALQIKSGEKYRRASAYAIPIDDHEDVWRQSTIPVAGIVHDAVSGQLYWVSISNFLAEHPRDVPSFIPVNADRLLTPETITSHFAPHFRSLANERSKATAVLQLCSNVEGIQAGALLDSFAAGRTDPRFFITMRYMMAMLTGDPLRMALNLLGDVVEHSDTIFTLANRVSRTVADEVKKHMRWSLSELRHFLTVVEWSEWQRGDTGQSLYVVIRQDPKIEAKIERLALDAIQEGDEKVAWPCFYLSIYWAGENGTEKYEELASIAPELEGLEFCAEVRMNLEECGCVSLFE